MQVCPLVASINGWKESSTLAILKRLNAPRQIVSHQNEHLRSKLTVTLTIVSLIFLSLYMPYAIVQTVSYFVIRSYQSHCNIVFVLRLRKLKHLSELLNIGALAINFFFYILAVTHYRSSAIKMLHLDHFEIFTRYLNMPRRNFQLNHRSIGDRSVQQMDNLVNSNTQLLKAPGNDRSSNTSMTNTTLCTQFWNVSSLVIWFNRCILHFRLITSITSAKESA